MSTASNLDDYRWLIGPGAGELLAETASSTETLVALAGRLRRRLSPPRAHRVLEQVELRRRAHDKFARAQQMFFTPRALEQATDEMVARYKAARFPEASPVADLCCGIGGDLLGLARRGPTIGVERDPIHALLVEANCLAGEPEGGEHPLARIETTDVQRFDLGGVAAWHLDPDRRAHGRRTTNVEHYEPPRDVIERLLADCAAGAIKLAPAAQPPDDWAGRAELEWISRGGQCRQLVAWFGDLARHRGRRRATLVSAAGVPLRTLVALPGLSVPVAADGIGRYLYEPDAAVLAANLTGALATELGLAAIAPGAAYLTSDQPVLDPAAAAFEVLDVLPFHAKTVREVLRARGIGNLEVKKRGVPHDPAALCRELAGAGEGSATLVVTRVARRVVAIIARRIAFQAAGLE